MDKRTMGSLMAALRKSKGLTQQEVADRLAVSNKTVSKWECDDGYPDITMLPAIAELYGITVDELLRGEVQKENAAPTQAAAERTEKQKEYLFDAARFKFKRLSILAAGIAVLSPSGAFVVGYSTYRCFIALGVALVFALAAIIVQYIAASKYRFTLGRTQDEMVPESTVAAYTTLRRHIFLTSIFVILGVVVGVAGTVDCPDGYSYATATLESFPPYLIAALLCACIYAVLRIVVKAPGRPRKKLSRAAKVYVIVLVSLSMLAVGVPFGVNTIATHREYKYVFTTMAAYEAFVDARENSKCVLLDRPDDTRLVLWWEPIMMPLTDDLDTFYDESTAEIMTYRLQYEQYDTVTELTFATKAAADAYVKAQCVDVALLGDTPLWEMGAILHYDISEDGTPYVLYLKPQVYISGLSDFLLVIFADALWSAGFVLAQTIKKKRNA